MKILVPGTIIVSSLFLAMPAAEAKAMGCQGIDGHGHCIDAKTVEWCDDGVLKTAKCPANEICAKHDDYGDGYLCIAKELTACAGVPDEGMCETDKLAVWCVEGELATKECGSDEFCGHDDEHGWVDCVPDGEFGADAGATTPPEPNSDASGGDGEGADEAFNEPDGATDNDDTAAPTPNVTEGKPWSANEPEGCRGAPSPATPIWLSVIVGFLYLRRKRLIGRL